MAYKRKKTKSGIDGSYTTMKPDMKNYQRGALIGGGVGLIAGFINGRRIILFGLIGALFGGGISYAIHKDDGISVKKKLNKYK